MSPQPTTPHNQLVVDLVLALAASAKGRGLRIFHDAQAMYDPDDRGDPYELPIPGVKNWRVPDLTIVHARHLSERGTEGHAELVIEVLSPDDEARAKLPYYARLGCREVWLVSRDRSVEVFSLRDGAYVVIAPDADGSIVAPSLALTLRTVATPDGPRLRIADGASTCDV